MMTMTDRRSSCARVTRGGWCSGVKEEICSQITACDTSTDCEDVEEDTDRLYLVVVRTAQGDLRMVINTLL